MCVRVRCRCAGGFAACSHACAGMWALYMCVGAGGPWRDGQSLASWRRCQNAKTLSPLGPCPEGTRTCPRPAPACTPRPTQQPQLPPGQPFSSKGRGGGTGQRASSCPQPELLWEEPGQPPPSPGPVGSEQGAARSEGPCQGAGPWTRPSPFLGCPLGAELPKGSGSCTSCDQARLELPPQAGAQQKHLVVHEPPQNS